MESISSDIAEQDISLHEILDETLDINKTNLSLIQKIHLKLFNRVLIKKARIHNWTSVLPIYVFKCPSHGLQITYPMGWRNNLVCLKCLSNLRSEEKKGCN